MRSSCLITKAKFRESDQTSQTIQAIMWISTWTCLPEYESSLEIPLTHGRKNNFYKTTMWYTCWSSYCMCSDILLPEAGRINMDHMNSYASPYLAYTNPNQLKSHLRQLVPIMLIRILMKGEKAVPIRCYIVVSVFGGTNFIHITSSKLNSGLRACVHNSATFHFRWELDRSGPVTEACIWFQGFIKRVGRGCQAAI